jgi:class 3 adenylate cyclase
MIHTFVFGTGSLGANLLALRDPNELWMRSLIVVLLVGFGAIAERSVRAERRLQERARQLDSLRRFVDRVRQASGQVPVEPPTAFPDRRQVGRPGGPGSAPGGRSRRIEDLAIREDEIGQLSRMLQELSSLLEARFRELYALLQLTHEISQGLLLDEVLDKAYEHLRSVIPYDRLGVALIDETGRRAYARWARSDSPRLLLGAGYSAPLHGSSLQRIIETGEPRIINDLAAHLRDHPGSESTRLILAEGIRSSLTCPLVSMGKPIGFAFFSSRSVDAYRSAHVDMFKAIAGHFSVVVDKSNIYQQVLQEKEKSERLLLNVVPARIADRLRAGEDTIAEGLPEVDVVFVDIVGFTGVAGSLPPDGVVGFLRGIFGLCDRLCDRHGLEKIKTIGDEYMAISGPSAPDDGRDLQRAASFALDLLQSVQQFHYPDGAPVQVRIGIHAGPAVAGVIGQKKFAYDIWGDTVNVASRMQSHGEPGRIQVSSEVYERLRDRFAFDCRGPIEVKGKGSMTTYFLRGEKAETTSREARGSASP